MAPVIAVFNMKGGVGKTTVSAHLVQCLAETKSKKILVVDLDPQFNLTQLLMNEQAYERIKQENRTVHRVFHPAQEASLFDVVETPMPPPNVEAIRERMDESPNHVYDLIAGDMDLVRFGILREADALTSVQYRFQRFMGESKGEYDAVFMDCNPSGSFLTTCALRAADRLLVPVKPDRYSMLGLKHVSSLLEMLPEIRPKPKLDILMNGEPRNGPMSAVETEIRKHREYGRLLLANKIYTSNHLKADPGSSGFATHQGGPWSGVIRSELKDVSQEYATRLGWT